MKPLEILNGRRVLVTGHTGFKGSWLSLWLFRLGASVTGFSLDPPTSPSNFDVSNIEGILDKHIIGDIRNFELLRDTIHECQPDLIMHLAAQSVVKTGYEDPVGTYSTNVMGTVNVLESVRSLQKPCAVFCVTSDKCYENREQTWGYRECDALGESDPYGASKGAADIAIRSYRKSFFPVDKISSHGVRVGSGRAGNVVGGGDWTDHGLIADVVRAFDENKPVEIRNPNAQRPWQHVLQCLSGYLQVSSGLLKNESNHYCTAWNFGPSMGNELPVKSVVNYLKRHWPGATWKDVSSPQDVHESQILRLSTDKAIWELKWAPAWNVYQTLDRTAEWFKTWSQGDSDMQQFSLKQIEDYEADWSRVGAADEV